MIRHRRYSTLAAVIADLGVAVASAPVQPTEGVAPTARDWVAPTRAERRKKKQTIGEKAPQRWQWDKAGAATDGVGNYRSAKRLRRLILTELVGVQNTGRQWNRLRKLLRREAPVLLTMHPVELLQYRAYRRAA